jgi:hypothetical protein
VIFPRVDTKLRLHYISLCKLSGLRVLDWGKTSTRRQVAITYLVRSLVFATLRPRGAATVRVRFHKRMKRDLAKGFVLVRRTI